MTRAQRGGSRRANAPPVHAIVIVVVFVGSRFAPARKRVLHGGLRGECDHSATTAFNRHADFTSRSHPKQRMTVSLSISENLWRSVLPRNTRGPQESARTNPVPSGSAHVAALHWLGAWWTVRDGFMGSRRSRPELLPLLPTAPEDSNQLLLPP